MTKHKNKLELISDPKVKDVFSSYPMVAQDHILSLRKLIISTALEIEGLNILEETLKWGEPSYITKFGSTIRIDWKKKKPEQTAIYFKCTSKLVSTFRFIYANIFKFEGNRAIILNFTDTPPLAELKHCITVALTYHKIKHLPFLGMQN